MEATFILFAKPPIAGHSKTRLARGIGSVLAARFASAFLRDSWAQLSAHSEARCVCSSTVSEADLLGLPAHTPIWRQSPGDLGDRLDEAFSRALKESPIAIGFGADSPGLPPELIHQARTALHDHDAVIGPTRDGGYYLIGLKTHPAPLFNDLPWSQPTTCEATLNRLNERGLSVHLLPQWWDVDEADDLNTLRDYLTKHPLRAPLSKQLLKESN